LAILFSAHSRYFAIASAESVRISVAFAFAFAFASAGAKRAMRASERDWRFGAGVSCSDIGRVVDTFSSIKANLAEATLVTGWTWHDFRRSFATALGGAGIPEAVADAVLNHR
jgi:hypothetical protein